MNEEPSKSSSARMSSQKTSTLGDRKSSPSKANKKGTAKTTTTTTTTAATTLQSKLPARPQLIDRSKVTSKRITPRKVRVSHLRRFVMLMLMVKVLFYVLNIPSSSIGTCSRYDCSFLGRQVGEQLSSASAAACTDFHDFACYHVTRAKIPSYRDRYSTWQIISALGKPISAAEKPGVSKFKKLYQLCHKGHSINDLRMHLTKTLNIKRWPLLPDDDKRLPWSWETLAGRVSQWNVDAVFGVHKRYNSDLVKVKSVFTEDLNYSSDFIAMMFGHSNSSRKAAVVMAKYVYTLHLQLNNLAGQGVLKVLDYAEMKKTYKGIKFDQFITTSLERPEQNISMFRFHHSPKYFEVIAEELATNHSMRLVMKNLILAKLLHHYSDRDNKLQCYYYLRKNARIVYNHFIVQWMGNATNRRHFKKFAENIRQFYATKLRQLKSIDDNVRQWALNQVLNIRFVIGWPDALEDEKLLSSFDGFSECTFPPGQTYFGGLFCLKRQARATRLWKPRYEFSELLEGGDFGQANAYYNGHEDLIYIGVPIIMPPLYDPDYPPVINYAAAGRVVGHEIGHALDNKRIIMGSYGFPQQNRLKFERRLMCYVKHFNNFSVAMKGGKTMLDAALTLNENVADVNGAQVAYEMHRRALLRPADGDGDLLAPPGLPLNLTFNQLFFVYLAQSQCRRAQSWYKNVHAPRSVRVLGTMSSMAEFADAFRCPIGSPMRPLTECRLWD